MTALSDKLRARPSATPSSGDEGFGLLEALVALALLAGTLVSIFALVGGILDSANRVGRSNISVQLSLNAVEAMEAVNPMLRESGKIDAGPYAINWTSAPLGPPIDLASSIYRIGLYECDVRVTDPAGTELTRLKLRRVGYRKMRDPGPTMMEWGGGASASGNPMPAR